MSKKEFVEGAYDKGGRFWYKEDIENFSSGIIILSFGKMRGQIKIIRVEKNLINGKKLPKKKRRK